MVANNTRLVSIMFTTRCCLLTHGIAKNFTHLQTMDKTIQPSVRQPSPHSLDSRPEYFHKLYENQFNRASLPFLPSMDSGSSTKSKLYRVLMPHGKVDRVIDLDPYNIQSFYEQDRKNKDKQVFRLPASPVVFSGALYSPRMARTSTLCHDPYQQTLGPRTSRAATHPHQEQPKDSSAIPTSRPTQIEAKSTYPGTQYALPGYFHGGTSRGAASLHEGHITGSVVAVYDDFNFKAAYTDEDMAEEEVDSVSKLGTGYPLNSLGQHANYQAYDFHSSADGIEIKKEWDRISSRDMRAIPFTNVSKVVAGPPKSASIAAASFFAVHKTQRLPNMKRLWTEDEHNAVLHELQVLRAEETQRGVLRKNWCTGTGLWGKIANELKKYNFEFFRTPISVSLYWNRYGRVKSGFDERRVPEPGRLLASLQKSRSDRK